MGLLFVAVLALFAWLMISRRLTATLALPLAALSLAIVALIPQAIAQGVMPALSMLANDVVDAGVTKLATWVFAVILGAVLAAQLRITGAAERMVRYAAEYAGEDRFRLGLLLLVVIALLFTTLGGLGAVIMVASITLPLMFSLGFEPKVAGGLFLLGLSLGGCFNPVNWQAYVSILGLTPAQIVPFAATLAVLFFIICCAYLLRYTTSSARDVARQLIALAVVVVIGAGLAYVVLAQPAAWEWIKRILATLMLILLALLALLLLARLAGIAFHIAMGRSLAGELAKVANWLTGAAILVPLLLLLWSTLHANLAAGEPLIQVPILTALAAGVLYSALASWTGDGAGINRTMRALFDGVTQAGPAVVLLIGIGMLLKATALPQVADSLSPWIARLPYSTPLGFVAVFFVLSPLALYRGPLNLYGMGAGLLPLLAGQGATGIISGSTVLAPALIMAAFFSVGMLQGVCDPTNTHNVWIGNFCKVPTAELTRLTLPWVLVVVLLGLVAGAAMFAAGFQQAAGV